MTRTAFRPRLRTLLLGLLAGVTLAAASVDARQATAVATAGAAPADVPVPLLWKVSDGDNAVYLLGSFHLLKPTDYPLSPDIDAALADAEHVMFELSPAEMASPDLGMKMAQAALRTDGSRLSAALPPEVATALAGWMEANRDALAAQGLQPQMLEIFEPWFVGLMVSVTEMTQRGLDPELGLDRHIADAATAAGKTTGGLELGHEQIAFFDTMDPDEQVQMLADALSGDQGGAQVDQLHAAWRRGDADALWHGMAVDMRREYPALYQRINVDRNDAWVPKLEARLKQHASDDTLVVVGALHLLGEDGVVEKLRARGYRVERVCSACAR